jgi:uncharacterized OB-fold protein
MGGAGQQVKDTLRGKAWDAAYVEAVEEGKTHFKHCTRCGTGLKPQARFCSDCGTPRDG